MTLDRLPVVIDRKRIEGFCRERGIRKLSLFGSVLRKDFDSTRSDVDVLAEFEPGIHPGLKFFGYGAELGAILGTKVEVLREAATVYEQA
jgi:predicted nucleotidyltransferase